MRTSFWWLVWLMRRGAIAAPGASLMLAVVIAFTSCVAMVSPVLLARAADDALRYDVQSTVRPEQTDVVAQSSGGPVPGASKRAERGLDPAVDAVWGAQDDALAELHESMPQPLRSTISDPQVLVTSDPVPLVAAPGGRPFPLAQVGLQFDPRFRDQVSLVDGRWPKASTGGLPGTEPLELVVSQPVSDAVEWQIGETRKMVFGDGQSQTIILTGIVAGTDSESPYWLRATSTLRPSYVPDSTGGRIAIIHAFGDPASWSDASDLPVHMATQAWFPTLRDTLEVSTAPQTVRQLREFTSSAHPVVNASTSEVSANVPLDERSVTSLSFGSRLPAVVNDSLVRATTTDEVLAMSATGAVGVLVVVLLLSSSLLLRRRTATLALLSARGASTSQRLSLLAAEGAVIGFPAAILGTAAAAAILGMQGLELPTSTFGDVARVAVAIIGLGLTPSAVLLGQALALGAAGPGAVASSGGSSTARDASAVTRHAVPLLRWVGIATLIATTAASIVLLARPEASSAAFDPVAAATPMLMALTLCVPATSVYPIALSAVVRRAHGRPGVVQMLGASRARRQPPGGILLTVAIVLSLGASIFSTVFISTVHAGIDSAAIASVGADVRLTAQGIPETVLEKVSAVPGVEAATAVYADQPVVVNVGGSRTRLRVVVVDTGGLAEVQRGRPDAITLPTAFDGRGGSSVADDPIPVLVSPAAAAELAGTEAEIDGHPLAVVATAPEPGVLPFTTATLWLLVDRADEKSLVGSSGTAEQILVRVAPHASPDEIERTTQAVRDLLQASVPGPVDVTTASDAAAETVANPRIAAVQALLTAAALLALALGVGGIVMTLALGRKARWDLLTTLAALGATSRERASVAAWDAAPTTIVAALAGILAGATTSAVVLSLTDLTAFTGGVMRPEIVVDPLPTLGVILGFVLASAIVIAIGSSSDGLSDSRPSGGARPSHRKDTLHDPTE